MTGLSQETDSVKYLRALIFDLDDTLRDNGPVLMAAEQSLYDWLVRHYPRIERHYRLEDMWNLRRDLLQLNPDLRHIDHIIIFNVLHLKRMLRAYFSYYHKARTHLALDKQCPEPR